MNKIKLDKKEKAFKKRLCKISGIFSDEYSIFTEFNTLKNISSNDIMHLSSAGFFCLAGEDMISPFNNIVEDNVENLFIKWIFSGDLVARDKIVEIINNTIIEKKGKSYFA